MRILHITPTFKPATGGIENVVDCLSRESNKHGIHTDVAHVAHGLTSASFKELDGRTVYKIPVVGCQLAGLAPKLAKIACGYDLLHVHDPQLLSLTASVRLFSKQVPAVLSTHGGFNHTKRFKHLKTLHERFLLKHMIGAYEKVLATSQSDQTYFSNFSSRVYLAENGIELNRFGAGSTANSPWKWLYWGRIARHKRLDLIIDLAVRARKLGFPVELTITGDDFDRTLFDLKTQIDLVEKPIVSYLPAQSDEQLRHLIAKSGIYISASEHEGFGLTFLEAMAAGMGIITRDIAPMNGFVNEQNGLLLSFSDQEKDDASLKKFLKRFEKNMTSIRSCAQITAGGYAWNIRFNDFVAGYRSALGPEGSELLDSTLKGTQHSDG